MVAIEAVNFSLAPVDKRSMNDHIYMLQMTASSAEGMQRYQSEADRSLMAAPSGQAASTGSPLYITCTDTQHRHTADTLAVLASSNISQGPIATLPFPKHNIQGDAAPLIPLIHSRVCKHVKGVHLGLMPPRGCPPSSCTQHTTHLLD